MLLEKIEENNQVLKYDLTSSFGAHLDTVVNHLTNDLFYLQFREIYDRRVSSFSIFWNFKNPCSDLDSCFSQKANRMLSVQKNKLGIGWNSHHNYGIITGHFCLSMKGL